MAPKKKPSTAEEQAEAPVVATKTTRTRKKAAPPPPPPEEVVPEAPSYVFRTEDEVPEIDVADVPLPPPTFEELYRKAAMLYQGDKADEAWVTLTEVAALATTTTEKVELANLQAAVLFRGGKSDEALAKAKEAVALDENHILARQNEITLRMALGRESLETLQTSVEQLVQRSMDPSTLYLVQELALRYFARRDIRGLRRGRGVFSNLPVLWKRLLDAAPDAAEKEGIVRRFSERLVPVLPVPIASMTSKELDIYHQRVDTLMGGNEARSELIRQAWTLVTQQWDDPVIWRGFLRSLLERAGPSCPPWERPFWEAWFVRAPKPRATPDTAQAIRAFLSWLGVHPSEAYRMEAGHIHELWKDPLWDAHGEPARPLRIGWVWQGPARAAQVRFWQKLLDGWSTERPVTHHVYKVGNNVQLPDLATAVTGVEIEAPGMDAVTRIHQDRLDVCVFCDWGETKWSSPLGWARHAPIQLAWGSAHRTAAGTFDAWLNARPTCGRYYDRADAPLMEVRRSDLGLSPGIHTVCVPHRPAKLTVRFLGMLKEILSRDPLAVALLLESPSPVEQEESVERVSELFGPYLATRVRWISPSTSPAMYLSTLQHATVVLLPPGMECPQVLFDAAYGRSCVVVSSESTEVVRILDRIPAGATLVAEGDGGYVQQAVRLLQEPNLRDNAAATLGALPLSTPPFRAWEHDIWRLAGAKA